MPEVTILNSYPLVQGAIALVIVLAWLVSWLRGLKRGGEHSKQQEEAYSTQNMMNHMFMTGQVANLFISIKAIEDHLEQQNKLLEEILDALHSRRK